MHKELTLLPVTILSIDPGITSGIALRCRGVIHTTTCSSMEEVYDLIRPPASPELVIFERFTAKLISTYGLHTVKLVGGIQALCYAFNIKCIGHMPQERKPFLDLARTVLLANSMPDYKPVIHEIDATAHLLAHEYPTQMTGGTLT